MTEPISLTADETRPFDSGEYSVVRSPINRGGAGILFFLAAFFSSEAIWELFGRSLRPTLMVLSTLSLLGIAFSAYALRRDRNAFPAKVSLTLYIGGLLMVLVPVAGFFWVLLRP